MELTSGSTTTLVPFVAVDATDLKTRETGLTGFTVYRSRNGGTLTAYTTPTIAESSASNAPGLYWLTVDEDTTISSGVNEEAYVVHISHASMAPVTLELTLKRPIVTAGQTITVANGCADADIERVTGNAVPATSSNGVLKVDVTHMGGTAGTFASGRPEVNTTHAAGTAWGSGAITAGSIATGAFTAAKFAANALDAVWSTATRLLTAGTNIVLAKGTGVTGFNDLSAAQVNAEADTALSDVGLTGTVTGRIDVAVSTRLASASYTAPDNTSIAAILVDTDTTIPGQISALNNLSSAEVNAEVVDALNTDTYPEPSQGAPSATLSLADKLGYLYKAWRNKKEQTSSEFRLFADDGTTVDQKSAVSDNGTTATRGEIVTGP